MAKQCTDCSYCDNDWKDGKTYCTKWKCWVKLREAEDCKDFEGKDSGCYLTTACTEVMGLPDNCFELETLRSFRDGYMTSEIERGEADIKEYYAIAPQIVKNINEKENAKAIWEELYYKEIKPCVNLVSNKMYEQAYTKYKQMTKNLSKKYL